MKEENKVTQIERLQKILDAFDTGDPQVDVMMYFEQYGVWAGWYIYPDSNLREDDCGHCASYRLHTMLEFPWNGRKVFLTRERIALVIAGCKSPNE